MTGYSNCDHRFEPTREQVETELKAGDELQHAAWYYCGWITFTDGQYHETVWVHHSPVASYSNTDLKELIDTVIENHGGE